MFIEVIQGHVTNPGALRASVERWVEYLAPRAEGWLGSTSGVAADGTAIALAMFDSEAAALATNKQADQAAWRRAAEVLFTGGVSVHNCSDVMTMLIGYPDEAGFVQVLQCRVANPDRWQALVAQSEAVLRRERPEILGTVIAVHDDDPARITEAVYFTSEFEARVGEQKALLSPEVSRVFHDMRTDLTYIDIHEPWLHRLPM
ncbi:hypothetical protein ACWDWO_06485 [Actinopolymorpha singaporensis]|uniref:ABM domain-containing protein n=1 Tax=Actinopolymorpha singaporensis TaxID=117157 RepID=A0A1H1R2X1_9ACTN|nr:hypothetical protein [Actinopolymorpha singaporensis]SDS29319.1 hypothetical protein SAMN04489717_2228 [Actinopolymorpha singaporensis]